MAELSGPAIAPGDLNEVYSVAAVPVGTRMFDTSGNQFIFLSGIGSTIVGSWVTYDELGVTTLLVANASGPVAIAMSASIASKWGWYCIFGSILANISANTADNAILGFETTSGYAGDGRAAGDLAYGTISRSSTGANAGTQVPCQIWYPFVDDQTAAH